jgi:prepilin signal peptidase PulO-like enzyme (type II secretory pathway)
LFAMQKIAIAYSLDVENAMTAIDRRTMLLNRRTMLLKGVLLGAAIAGLPIVLNTAESTPLAVGMAGAIKAESLVEKAQVVVVAPGRCRRWVMRRGRRVCGWR